MEKTPLMRIAIPIILNNCGNFSGKCGIDSTFGIRHWNACTSLLPSNKPINNNRKQSTHHRGANQKTRAVDDNNGKVRQQKNQNNRHQKPVA